MARVYEWREKYAEDFEDIVSIRRLYNPNIFTSFQYQSKGNDASSTLRNNISAPSD